MVEVVFVRHAEPVAQRDVPARLWRLGKHGRAAAQALSAVIPEKPFAVSSDERKARETAEMIVSVRGGALIVDPRFAETRRPDEWADDFAARAREFLAGRQLAGWESGESVADRFHAAVADALRASDGPLVVFTHGQALTLWLQRMGAIADPVAFWSRLGLPDAWRVQVDGRRGRLAAVASLERLREPGLR